MQDCDLNMESADLLYNLSFITFPFPPFFLSPPLLHSLPPCSSISVSKLEPELRATIQKASSDTKTVYFNKGL